MTDRKYYPTVPDPQMNKELQLVWDQIHGLNGQVQGIKNQPKPEPMTLTGDVQLAGPSQRTAQVMGLMGYKIKPAQLTNGQVLTFVSKDSQLEFM